ncbi:hypothetical protein AB0H71_29865 [Nocardia sp. NPDC050697]|uniref:hypothetical protein n=1 Tax=Nocardia sp. NPDC050697 TaxID=3155158 RepID=UPI0033DD0F1C
MSSGISRAVPSEYVAAAIGSTLSIAAAIASYKLGVSADTSFVVGLIGVVISLQAEVLVWNTRLRHSLSEMGEISSVVMDRPEYSKRILSILRSIEVLTSESESINAIANPIFMARASRLVTQCQNDLSVMAGGTFVAAQYDFGSLDDAISRARYSLIGVALQGVDRVTFRELGGYEQYLHAQREALARGVTIERIFIHSQRNENLIETMDEQVRMGIRVFEIDVDLVPPYLRVDCAIVDNSFYGRIESSPAGGIIATRYSRNEAELNARVSEFEELKTIARRYSQSGAAGS